MDALLWQEKALSLLDQTRYPQEELWHDCKDYRSVVSVLKTPAVSGEAILACAGAYAYCLAALEYQDDPAFFQKLTEAKGEILGTHPKSLSLAAAIARLDKVYEEYRNSPDQVTALLATAVTIHRQDVVAGRSMSRFGREILPEEAKVILSCRGSLFHTGGFGGPVGLLRSALLKQKIAQVYLCENRPGLEGSRLLAHELLKHKIPTTVIPDHAAAALMPRRSCDLVLIEGLRLAANGDLLAGPGTYELAIAAYFHSIPVYATVFTSEIDLNAANGEAFPQGDGDSSLLSHFEGKCLLPEGVTSWNPGNEVLPHYLLTGLITDKGVIFPPYEETITETLTKAPEKNVLFL